MALIEIPNARCSGASPTAAGRGRLTLIGEPIVAVDLVNTGAAPGSPARDDLLASKRGAQAWWQIEQARLPPAGQPDLRALRRLRAALREVLEALLDDRPVPAAAVSELNFFTQLSPTSIRLTLATDGLRAQTHWHSEFAGHERLAFIARQAARFLSEPGQVRRLRRCANPACSMIFIASNPRRSWCAEVCGNRVRVARHHRRDAGA
jgi:predicted RNA-binding Zn ribbon-like protein